MKNQTLRNLSLMAAILVVGVFLGSISSWDVIGQNSNGKSKDKKGIDLGEPQPPSLERGTSRGESNGYPLQFEVAWEYDSNWEAVKRSAGAGWEITAIVPVKVKGQDRYIYYYKRAR